MGPSAVLGGYALATVTAWAKRRRGPLAITLAFLVLGMMNLILVPPFVPRDESSHVTYALAIADGRFPRIDDTNPAGAIPGLEPFKTWTANHPPLFYVLGAVPLEAGKAIDEPVLGLRGMRLLNLLFGAVARVPGGHARRAAAAARARRRRRSRRPALGLAGAVANNLAIAYNDGLGLAAAIALLVVGLKILREGPSRRLLVALALLAAVGGLARFTVFMAIGFAALLAAAGVYLQRPARAAARRRRGVLPAVRGGDRRVGLVVPSATGASTARSPGTELHHPDAGARTARRLPRAAPDAVVLAEDALRHLGRLRALRLAAPAGRGRSPRPCR